MIVDTRFISQRLFPCIALTECGVSLAVIC